MGRLIAEEANILDNKIIQVLNTVQKQIGGEGLNRIYLILLKNNT